MVDKNDDLIIQVAADTAAMRKAWTKVESEVTGLSAKVNRQFGRMGQQIDRTFANVGRNMMRNLTGPLAGIGGVLATREVMQYADAWTEAGNKVAAAGSVVGMAGRSLEGIRQIADDSRAEFSATIDLYTRMLRSAGDVAESELEIARATEIVNRAFKAGGASASEMAAGVLQLSQGLSSGMLQGDELRSVRENAPLLAEAIADYFGTTIGGLKELGAQGELTSERIFAAILAAGDKVDAAFATTNATIQDSITRVQNALVQYIGSADQSLGATAALNAGLNALADNFDAFADVGLKLAAIIAGALVGRSIVPMVASLGVAGKGIVGFVRLLTGAASATGSTAAAFGALGAAAGPLAAIIGGGVLLGLQHMVAENARVRSSIERITDEMESLGLAGHSAAEGIDAAAEATDRLTAAEARREGRQAQENLGYLRNGGFWESVNRPITANIDLDNLEAIADRANDIRNALSSDIDQSAYQSIREMARALSEGRVEAEAVRAAMLAIRETDVSQPVADLAVALDEVARRWGAMESKVAVTGVAVDDARASIELFLDGLNTLGGSYGFSEELQGELRDISDGFDGTKESAEEVFQAIFRLAQVNPDLRRFLPALNDLVVGFHDVANAADTAAAAIDRVSAREAGQARANSYVDWLTARGERGQDTLEFMTEQNRLLGLTREQRDLEQEIAAVRREAADAGADITDARAMELAQQRLAWAEANKRSGGGKSDAEQFRERLEQERQSVALLQQEAALMAQLNPLAANYETTLEAWRMEQELLNDARKAGLADDPAVIAGIQEIVAAWQSGTEAINAVQEAQDAARESMQQWFDLAKSATQSFIQDLIDGKSAADALANALSNIGNYLINLGLGAFFGTGNGNFGLLGQMLNLPGHASGTANTGGRRGEPRGIVHGQEAVIPLPNGGRVPVDIRVPSVASAATQQQQLTVRVVSDDEKFSAYVENGAGHVVARSAPTIVGASVSRANKAAPAAIGQYQRQRGGEYRV